MAFQNGQPWLDTDGNVIHAHGGHILYHDGWYYWYGEDRRDNIYVSCYRSRDLQSFEFRGHVITTNTPTSHTRLKRADLELLKKKDDTLDKKPGGVNIDSDSEYHKVNIERPKVLYCAATKKFVMWMHFENGTNYLDARCAVATSDYPDRDFVYHGSFNPMGDMARDCTLFLDDDGHAYFIAASRSNADLHVWRLTRDFLNVDKLVNVLFSNEYREAPAMMKKDGRYYLYSSYCSGWAPNQGAWSSADSIDGEWTVNDLFGDDTTYRSQPSFILEKDGRFIYFGDRWGGRGDAYFDSTYVVLPIDFDENGRPSITYSDEAALS